MDKDIVPNQAIATYVTQWAYDSHNRLLEMIYPDEEKVSYTYDLGGQLTNVHGYKSYGYDYVNRIGYDKFGQRTYMKYCNGAETFYTYEPQRRRLKWDEENRLLASDDDGFVTNYWYDADGERTVKTSGESEQVYVNSEFAGGRTNTAKFSLYVSPYLVANQGGRYTKHIYIGSQRIVSKIGDFASYGADPRRIQYAGKEADAVNVDYDVKYSQQLQAIKENYATFGVPYNGTDNDDYVDGEGFCCDDGTMEAAIAQANAPEDNFQEGDAYENLQFYYHTDHLGSSSYITNLDGEVVQHIEYVPFGEVFIEERNNIWNTPYLFNAKEFDEETGLYYYGARYYAPRLSLWMSTDPKQEDYYNVCTYCYVICNPTKFIDIEGYKPRIYYELQQLGHTFVTTGSGSTTTVYTYGRYAGLGKDKSSARNSTPTGEGVLIILKGQEARKFIEDQINNRKAVVYEFVSASDAKVDKFFQDKFNNSDKIPTVGKYAGNENARVIDEYNLLTNNCTTISIEAIKAGGGDTSFFSTDFSPLGASKHTSEAIIFDKIKSWFGADRKIITIDPKKVLNEFKAKTEE